MSRAFKIPDDFRAFMREVARKMDWDDRADLVGAEALTHECGRGGIVPGGEMFRFSYFEPGQSGRWEIELREQQIRDIAGGLVDEVEAVPLAEGTRVSRGEALLVWGEYDDDALRVRTSTDLVMPSLRRVVIRRPIRRCRASRPRLRRASGQNASSTRCSSCT